MKRKQRREELIKQLTDESISAEEIDTKIVHNYKSFYNRVVKRLLDLIFSSVILIIISPVFLIISLMILIEDGRPVFYRAQRGGYHGKTFRIFKFRSMVKNADQIGGGTTALNDERITRIGKFIRKIKADEISNLINVFLGQMSLIGPRPELLQYTNMYSGCEELILEARPGITDYSSLEFINLDEIVGDKNADQVYEQYILPRKNKLRIKYVATVSFLTDVKIFFLTIWKVVGKIFRAIFKKRG